VLRVGSVAARSPFGKQMLWKGVVCLTADITRAECYVCFVPILLQKSVEGFGEQ